MIVPTKEELAIAARTETINKRRVGNDLKGFLKEMFKLSGNLKFKPSLKS